MSTNDPILSTFNMHLHRAVLFLFLWIIAFFALLYAIAGDHMTLREWWELFDQVTSPDCPPAILHILEITAAVAALPVIMIFMIIGGWWRRQGIAALRAQSGSK